MVHPEDSDALVLSVSLMLQVRKVEDRFAPETASAESVQKWNNSLVRQHTHKRVSISSGPAQHVLACFESIHLSHVLVYRSIRCSNLRCSEDASENDVPVEVKLEDVSGIHGDGRGTSARLQRVRSAARGRDASRRAGSRCRCDALPAAGCCRAACWLIGWHGRMHARYPRYRSGYLYGRTYRVYGYSCICGKRGEAGRARRPIGRLPRDHDTLAQTDKFNKKLTSTSK
eukprot:SAG31_NODE_855_length_11461_cov_5.496215_15_plen_229_part_00